MTLKPLHVLLILLILSLGFNIYFFSKPKERITIPPIIGKFEPAIPISQKPKGEPLTVTWKTEKETIYIKSEGQVNDSLLSIYRDSIGNLASELERETQRAEMYLDAITFREFTHTFEDDYLKAEVQGITQGYIKEVSIPSYEIKEREIEVPTYHRILAGGEIGNTTTFSNFQYKVNVGLQNPKGNIYRVGYSKEGFEDVIWVGYEASVFKW